MSISLNKQVLVVDDEQSIVEGLTMLLDAEAIESTGAGDRTSAVELLTSSFYPIIIADLCLKTTADGLELLNEIRRLSPRSRVVTISGYATPELEAEVIRRGASLVLHKPMTGDVILAAISELLAEIEREAAEQEEPDLDALYMKVKKVLYSIPRRKYGLSHDVAEDIVQQAWLLFLEKRADVRCARKWLSGTAVNLSRQEIDRLRRARDPDADEALDAVHDDRTSNYADVVAVRQALQRLDERSRDLCEWIGLEGYSYDEVSNATAVPIGSVGPLYIRAKQKLHSELIH